MLYNYKDLRKIYNSSLKIKKLLENNELFKIEKGIYSNQANISYLEFINFKYPNAIITLDSAFYYYKLTDIKPNKTYLAIKRDSYQANDVKVKFITCIDKYFNLGLTNLNVEGVKIKIYDKERLLIELIRNRNSYDFDYYKEIINNYRKIKNDLDMKKLNYYISNFPNKEHILDVIRREVF